MINSLPCRLCKRILFRSPKPPCRLRKNHTTSASFCLKKKKKCVSFTILPVFKCFFTFCTPTRQGKPYSLAMTAPAKIGYNNFARINVLINWAWIFFFFFDNKSFSSCVPWDITPPISVTRPEIIGKYGDQAMSTDFTIRTSPARKWRASSMRSNTHARFFTRPANTQQPLSGVEPSTGTCSGYGSSGNTDYGATNVLFWKNHGIKVKRKSITENSTSSGTFIGTGGPQHTSSNCSENNAGHSFRLFNALKSNAHRRTRVF